jgi:succinate dehydrogenase / fumarate reductase iron-sulfur subunit
MKLNLKIWRQDSFDAKGAMVNYPLDDVSEHMSFLEMMDLLNETLVQKGERVIEFDHDCREGICGQCGIMINGRAHGPLANTTTCQLHMRSFKDGDTIYIEPFRATAFPIIRDLKVDRKGFDHIIQAGGFITASTGQPPEAADRVINMVDQMDAEGFGHCSNTEACEVECPQSISVLHIARMNYEYNKALLLKQ